VGGRRDSPQAPPLTGQGDDAVLTATQVHLVATAVRTTVTFAELPVQSLVQPLASRAFRRELVASLAGECGRPRGSQHSSSHVDYVIGLPLQVSAHDLTR
jgi:hypothetical protein